MIYQLAVLLTSYNQKQKTLTCLQKVFEQECISDIQFSIYLVDNNSTDGAFETIHPTYPTVTILIREWTAFWGQWCEIWNKVLKEKKSIIICF